MEFKESVTIKYEIVPLNLQNVHRIIFNAYV